MYRRFFFAVVALCVALFAFAACESNIPREAVPRFDFPIPPDAEVDVVTIEPTPTGDAAIADAASDASDADAGVDAAVPNGPLLATGSGLQPDVAIGNGDHTCVSVPDAGVFCWGANDHGQLGIGTTVDAPSAMKLATDENGLPFGEVNELALAPWHSCARRGNELFCWGQRFTGAQAEPPSALEPDRTLPRAIGNLAIAHVAAGGPHTCVMKMNGRHVCVGDSTFGELARSPAADLPCTAPFLFTYQTEVAHTCSASLVEPEPPLANLSAIAAGDIHSCAISGGRVSCWGANGALQLGRIAVVAQDPLPAPVMLDGTATLDGATALASGGKHSCAIAAGKVICWGDNEAPKAVAGITNPTAVGVAEGVACAIQGDKTVVCWGNDLSALGDAGVASSPTPKLVAGLTNVVTIAPGFRHACAQKMDGSVFCWGKNDRGQLGDGTKIDSAIPVKVIGLP